jgi:small subunit ribosomal protein S13
MVRIAGVELPRTKRIEYALTSIYGIGLKKAQTILIDANIDRNLRTNELTDSDVSRIREVTENKHKLEGDLRRVVSLNIKRLSEINCVRGRRHREKLPLRGQRTRTNARTRRGAKKTIAGKKK